MKFYKYQSNWKFDGTFVKHGLKQRILLKSSLRYLNAFLNYHLRKESNAHYYKKHQKIYSIVKGLTNVL